MALAAVPAWGKSCGWLVCSCKICAGPESVGMFTTTTLPAGRPWGKMFARGALGGVRGVGVAGSSIWASWPLGNSRGWRVLP